MNSDTKTKAQPQDSEETEAETDKARFEKDYILETGSVLRTKGRHAIHCLTVIGQIEGHSIAPQTQKTTKYEHVIPQLVSIEEDPEVEGLLVILNTVGGDVEAGLVLGVPQTMRYFEQMQQRITGFVAGHSHISEARFTELMMHTGELVMDMGSVVDGETAVAEGLIDELGGLGDALHYLYRAIEAPRDGAPEQRKAGGKPRRAPRAHSAGK